MKKILAILLIMCCALPAVAKKRQNEEIITPLTQLEKRQFQTKSYPAQDNIVAMKSVLNVLQDEGFIVYNVNSLLGYIYGVKDFDISDPNVDISKEFGLTKSRLNYNGVKVATLEVSVNVTQFGEQTRIRTNFKRKLFNEYGNAQMIDDIDEAEYYSDFYKKVDDAIVLQKQIAQKTKKEETPVSVKRQIKKPPVKRPVHVPAPVIIQQDSSQVQEVPKSEQITTQPAVEDKESVKQEETQKTSETVEVPVKNENSSSPESAEVKQEKQQQEVREPVAEKTEETKPSENAPKTEPKSEPKTEPKSEPKTEPASEYTPEQILDLVPVDSEPEQVKSTKEEAKELKEMVKQVKAEAKQAQKEALQAQKEAMQLQKDLDKQALEAEKEALKAEKEAQKQALKEEKEALKEAKRQAKEMKE